MVSWKTRNPEFRRNFSESVFFFFYTPNISENTLKFFLKFPKIIKWLIGTDDTPYVFVLFHSNVFFLFRVIGRHRRYSEDFTNVWAERSIYPNHSDKGELRFHSLPITKQWCHWCISLHLPITMSVLRIRPSLDNVRFVNLDKIFRVSLKNIQSIMSHHNKQTLEAGKLVYQLCVDEGNGTPWKRQ